MPLLVSFFSCTDTRVAYCARVRLLGESSPIAEQLLGSGVVELAGDAFCAFRLRVGDFDTFGDSNGVPGITVVRHTGFYVSLRPLIYADAEVKDTEL